VDSVPLAGDRRHEVAAHHVAGCQIEQAKPLVIQLGGPHPGIQPKRPERLALIDVANTRAHALL
jgi:hypothetical protein